MLEQTLPQRLRSLMDRLHHALRARYWFPHVPLAVLVALAALALIRNDLGAHWFSYLQSLLHGHFELQPRLLTPLLIGIGLTTMALGLLMRSRLAWTMALLLLLTASVQMLLVRHSGNVLLIYFCLMVLLLIVSWRRFDRSGVAASTLFAITSVVMLLLYAVFGSLYFGAQFKPAITDIPTALYYSMVTMSTVGYGDITPQTIDAKLFTVSVIVLGVAIFATSLTAVIAPMVTNSLQRIVNHKGPKMKRENHFVVIGNSSLAINTWRELAKRGRSVTRLLREPPIEGELEDVDVVIGDANSLEVLRQAGAQHAEAVLAMLADDSENAFVILAVKELGGKARTIAAVNDAHHLGRVKLVQPDVVIAPQVLGGELLAMLLSGEEVSGDFVLERVFQQRASTQS